MNRKRYLSPIWSTLLLLWMSVVFTRGEILTLQLPFGRATHSFALMEPKVGSPGDHDLYLDVGIPSMGILPGLYTPATVQPLGLVGGEFDSLGVWWPGDGAAMQALGYPNGTGTYFVYDYTVGQAAQANHTVLANATWMSPLSSSATRLLFFSLPTSRVGHTFAVSAGRAAGSNPWYAWYSPTVTLPQAWYDVAGNEYSLGFMEAWVFVPSDIDYAFVYDLSANEKSISTAPDVTPESLWEPTGEADFWPLAPVKIWAGENAETFELLSDGGQPQFVTATEYDSSTNRWAILANVGFGRSFWLSRTADGYTSQTFHVSWGMAGQVQVFWATVPTIPPDDWQTLTFRASPGRNPFGWKVRRISDGSETAISWNGWTNGTYVTMPDNSQVWVEWYDGFAYVNITGGWSVIDGSGNDLGSGPDFIDWPIYTPGPTASAWIAVPGTRGAHTLVSSEGLAPNTPGSGWWSGWDAFTGWPYEYSLQTYLLPINNPSLPLSLIDSTTQETSDAVDFSAVLVSETWERWHTTSDLLLKISATRWGNVLEIRAANGGVFPITRNKVQGDWSFDAGTGQSWFNSYGFFDARTFRHDGIPWHLYDATRQEILNASATDERDFTAATDNTDSDGDGLKDWEEHLLGTSSNAIDTDLDGRTDFQEVRIDHTNPRAGNAATSPNSSLVVFTPLE